MELRTYIDELKEKADIKLVAQDLGLKVNEQNQAACFNGHDKATPSLTFYEDSQSFHCYGCGAHGDVIDLVRRMTGRSFVDAMTDLAQQNGMVPWQGNGEANEFGQVRECLQTAAGIYAEWLPPDLDFLDERGISLKTARRYGLGLTRGNQDLTLALEEKGFDRPLIRKAGLLNGDDADFFHDALVMPIYSGGQVVDFCGRSLAKDASAKYKRLPNGRLRLGEALFNWNSLATEIIVVEGVLDALSLIQQGFENAVSTFGTTGFGKKRLLELFSKSRVETYFIAYDADEQGKTAALDLGHALQALGKYVQIIDLPAKDPNDFFLDHDRDEFLGLMASSQSPIDRELSEITTHEDFDDRMRLLDKLLLRSRKLMPIQREELFQKIHRQLKIPVKVIKEQYASLSTRAHAQDGQSATEFTDRSIAPSLDFVDGTTIMLVPRRVRQPNDPAPYWQNTIVTSGRERFVLTQAELASRGWYAEALEQSDLSLAKVRYSPEVVERFLYGKAKGDLVQTYERIRETMRVYLDLPEDETYDFLTAWAIGTYFFPIFTHYGYVHFSGVKNTGKTKCLDVLKCICHNAVEPVSMTTAVMFRIITDLQPTILFDEQELLNRTQYDELNGMLKCGFKKTGGEVYRMETNDSKQAIRRWQVYCPKAFASINPMEDVLSSRSTQIIMQRSFKESVKARSVVEEDPLWQSIRDNLFLVAMTSGADISNIYHSLEKPRSIFFSGREWDLFKPILSIGLACNKDVITKQLTTFAIAAHQRKQDTYTENAPDMILLRYLADVITKPDWYELVELHEGLKPRMKNQGLDMQGVFDKNRMGRTMKNLGVYDTKSGKKRTDRNTKVMYFLEPEPIKRILENHQRS
ncbi:MAG: toprim domain-containing protein [Desulfomonile tiedjei]|uniref:Toprim domain-containing protein n=1 Tax=Desulfomonile tiedjei TaxID=2358 RepID=A0A9D6Z5W2_9BACT|nr:toprim domain-containing protein [Desulfomonile tiedjei]